MLGDVVKAYRTERGWKQQELARRAGIGQAHVSLIERNQVPKPSPDTLMALARAFEITVDELLRAAGMELSSAEVQPEDGVTDWVAALSSIGPELTRAERVAVLEHAQALRDRRGRPRRPSK